MGLVLCFHICKGSTVVLGDVCPRRQCREHCMAIMPRGNLQAWEDDQGQPEHGRMTRGNLKAC